MSTPAIILMLVANIVVWGGLIFGIRWALRRGREHANHLGRPEHADPVTKHGHTMEVRRLWVASGTHERSHQHEFVDYCVQLPPPLARLNMIDGEAFEGRTNRLQPPVELSRVGAPNTDDDVFNGLFDFTSPPDAATHDALNNTKLRGLLQDLYRAYGNLWVQDGLVRVFQEGAPDEEEIDVNAELLTGIAVQVSDHGDAP